VVQCSQNDETFFLATIPVPVHFDRPGVQTLTLQINKVNLGRGGGFILRNLKLTPM
jgi:hypothetical protein